MKVVTWNCQGAFRRKACEIAAYKPDIAIIQECEHPDVLFSDVDFPRPTHHVWFGGYKHKGICVLSYTDLEFSLWEPYLTDIEYCVPLRVEGHVNVNLIAIWTQNHPDKNSSYVGQVFRAVRNYEPFIRSADTMVIGDFNSNQIWDKERTVGNHSELVSELKRMGIVSIYHEHYQEQHGSEKTPTFYMYRKADKPYHIDYCFVPSSWSSKVKDFRVGEFDKWCQFSDHVPLMLEFDKEVKVAETEVMGQ